MLDGCWISVGLDVDDFGESGWDQIGDKCKKFFGWEEFYQTVGCWSAQIEKYL